MGCNCKQKYKNNNLDNKVLVMEALNLYQQYKQDPEADDNYWDMLYAYFIQIYPKTTIHTKEYIFSEYDKLIKAYKL